MSDPLSDQIERIHRARQALVAEAGRQANIRHREEMRNRLAYCGLFWFGSGVAFGMESAAHHLTWGFAIILCAAIYETVALWRRM